MPSSLTAEQVARYRDTGIHFPIDVFSASEVVEMNRNFAALEAHEGGRLSTRTNKKPHLLVPWVSELIRHPRLLDAVESVIGPNILCWSSQFFAKPPRDPSYISWHQDATYWGLSTPEVVTAWIAFTPSTIESGCMRVVPGSHRQQVAHVDTFDERNMLTRGQELAVTVRDEEAVDVVLLPGQVSLHNVLIFHGSNPNRADHPRTGYAVRFIPPHVRQMVGERDSATLVRGEDSHGHFDLESPPETAFHPAAVAQHAAIVERQARVMYAGATQAGKSRAFLPEKNGTGADGAPGGA